MTIPILNGLAELNDAYDAFILDVWGVVHGGGPAYPEVVDCLARLRAAGKHVVFLSNAPRRAKRVAAVLADKGVDAGTYDAMISSGEATRLALEARREPALSALGPNYVMLSHAADDDLLDGLPYRMVETVGEADFVLAVGLSDDRPTVEAHEDILREAAERGLLMVCVNPDRLVIRLGQRELCAGALADRYAALGGAVFPVGKPHSFVYELCLDRLGTKERARVLAVGDGLETDITGAQSAGLDALLVTGGLLADQLGIERTAVPEAQALMRACAAAGATPKAAIPTLSW